MGGRMRLGVGRWRAGILMVFALLVGIGAVGCKRVPEAHPQMGPTPVAAAQVVERSVRETGEFNGRVWATDSVEIRPRVTGYVERIAFREGQMVHKGDLLYVIDPRPYRDAADSARAQLERERAAADFARIQAERAQRLRQSEAVSQEESQNRSSDLAQSAARVRAAEAALAAADLNVSYTEVRSPIDGRISRTQLTLGNLAQADQTVLTTVVSVNPVYVYFDCDEQSYLRFEQQAHAGRGVSGENPVRVGLADEQGFPHVGQIDFVDNQLNPATGTIRARVVLPNADNRLTPGLFARVQLESAQASTALLVDEKAVLTDQDRKYVYVVSADSKAVRRDVTLGGTNGGLRIVRTGLTTGDRVIVGGQQLIALPGVPVQAQAVPMEHAQGQASGAGK